MKKKESLLFFLRNGMDWMVWFGLPLQSINQQVNWLLPRCWLCLFGSAHLHSITFPFLINQSNSLLYQLIKNKESYLISWRCSSSFKETMNGQRSWSEIQWNWMERNAAAQRSLRLITHQSLSSIKRQQRSIPPIKLTPFLFCFVCWREIDCWN